LYLLSVAGDVLVLPDGRRVGLSIWGDLNGTRTVFFFPGIPGSRFSRIPDDSELKKHSSRVVTVERPGVGLSTPHDAFSFADCTTDTLAVAAHLGVSRFGVVAFSGGSPFALYLAAQQPQHVIRVGLLSPLYRYAVPTLRDLLALGLGNGVFLQTYAPRLTKFVVKFMAMALADPNSATEHLMSSLDAPDRALFSGKFVLSQWVMPLSCVVPLIY
jgi:pimeloyl-ACP methyl ester carboxylesterase